VLTPEDFRSEYTPPEQPVLPPNSLPFVGFVQPLPSSNRRNIIRVDPITGENDIQIDAVEPAHWATDNATVQTMAPGAHYNQRVLQRQRERQEQLHLERRQQELDHPPRRPTEPQPPRPPKQPVAVPFSHEEIRQHLGTPKHNTAVHADDSEDEDDSEDDSEDDYHEENDGKQADDANAEPAQGDRAAEQQQREQHPKKKRKGRSD